tara:strand:+ start:1007 stop:1273 length:267 start_codon:yes stop_codon:yes gene_type:complete
MASTSEYRGLGLNGGIYINDTNVATNSKGWFAIQATEDTVIQAQSSNITNLDDICQPVDNITLAAGMVLYGNFTSIDLTSGAVIAYNV